MYLTNLLWATIFQARFVLLQEDTMALKRAVIFKPRGLAVEKALETKVLWRSE